MSRDLRAEIIVSGTELLLGDYVDTNSAYISRKLRDLGIDVFYHTTVGDNITRLQATIELAMTRSNLILVTGGLGPTVDDVAREAIANAIRQPLVFSQALLEQIAARFARFGRPMSPNNRRQAYIPCGATPIPNPVGTAPAFRAECNGRIIVALPGVPREMEFLMENAVVPYLRQLVGENVIVTRVLHTVGIGESQVDATIADLMTSANPTVGLAAHPGQTDIRITAKAPSQNEAWALIQPVESQVRDLLHDHIYGADSESLAQVIAQHLETKRLRLCILETETRGLICQELLESGSSVVGHTVDCALDSLTEQEALEQARRLINESGCDVALVSLATCELSSRADQPALNTCAIAVMDTSGRQRSLKSTFGAHPALFQTWLVNQSLYLLWSTLIHQS